MREREGLISRIRQIRRVTATEDEASASEAARRPEASGRPGLEARIEHLEALVQGLQDSVHRESERQSKLIAELQSQIRPEVMSAALSKDARERGL